jgi:hypothetical protein
MPVEEKIRFADFRVDTSGSVEETLRQADELARRLSSAGRLRPR